MRVMLITKIIIHQWSKAGPEITSAAAALPAAGMDGKPGSVRHGKTKRRQEKKASATAWGKATLKLKSLMRGMTGGPVARTGRSLRKEGMSI
jgi:hypothetical protein